jgi:hypothetical protein
MIFFPPYSDDSYRMIRKSGYRFPACAKPRQARSGRLRASAGEGTSEEIMLKNAAKAKW